MCRALAEGFLPPTEQRKALEGGAGTPRPEAASDAGGEKGDSDEGHAFWEAAQGKRIWVRL